MSYDCYEYTIWTQNLFTENSKCNGTIDFESWLTFLVFIHVSSLDEQAELDFPVEFSWVSYFSCLPVAVVNPVWATT